VICHIKFGAPTKAAFRLDVKSKTKATEIRSGVQDMPGFQGFHLHNSTFWAQRQVLE
jgi:hypothetical protein